MATEELITELFKRGQLIRDHWWNAYKANLERLAAELRANEAFVADYGHLAAQLPDPPSDPFAAPSRGLGESMPESNPPPLPGYPVAPPGTYDDVEVGHAFEQRLAGVGRRG